MKTSEVGGYDAYTLLRYLGRKIVGILLGVLY